MNGGGLIAAVLALVFTAGARVLAAADDGGQVEARLYISAKKPETEVPADGTNACEQWVLDKAQTQFADGKTLGSVAWLVPMSRWTPVGPEMTVVMDCPTGRVEALVRPAPASGFHEVEAHIRNGRASGALYVRVEAGRGARTVSRIVSGIARPEIYLAVRVVDRAGPSRPAVRIPAATCVETLAKGRATAREIAFRDMAARPPEEIGAIAPRLAELVDGGDWPARCYAAALLQAAGPQARQVAPRIDKAAVAALAAGKLTEATMLARVLAAAGEETAPQLVKAVEGELGTPDDGRRLVALKVMVNLGPLGRPLLPKAVASLKSEDAELRCQAASVVALHGTAGKDAAPMLLAALGDKNPYLVRSAVRALAALGPDAAPAVPSLRALLRRTEPHLPEDAGATLGAIGPAAAVAFDDLAALLVADTAWQPRDKALSAAVEKALSGLGTATVPALVKLVQTEGGRRGPAAARILGNMGSTAAAARAPLLKIVQAKKTSRPDPNLAMNVGIALIKIDPATAGDALPALAPAVTSGDLPTMTVATDFLLTYARRATASELKRKAIRTMAECLKKEYTGLTAPRLEGLCRSVCHRLPSLGPEAESALPALRDAVYSQRRFGEDARRAWRIMRPKDEISDTPPIGDTKDKAAGIEELLEGI